MAVALRGAPTRHLLFLISAYLLLLLLAEGLVCTTADWIPPAGPACYGLLVLVLLGHAVLCWDRVWRAIPLLFACAAGVRLVLLSCGPAGRARPWPALALAIPTLVAVGAAARALCVARLSATARKALPAGLLAAVLLVVLGSGLAAAFPALQGQARSGLAMLGRAAAAQAPGAGGGLGAGQRDRPAPLSWDRVEALAACSLRRALRTGFSWPSGPAGAERLPPRWGENAGEPGPGGSAAPPTAERLLWPYSPLAAALSTSATASPREGVFLRRPTPAPDGLDPGPEALPADPPPLPPGCPSLGYDNLYPRGVCTWYAKERRPDLPSFAWDFGLAMYWPEAARLCGFRVDAEAAVGAVIVFPPGANGADAGGHVGYVEEVGADYLLISECNVSTCPCHEQPIWWERGYLCVHHRFPYWALDAGIVFIHGRE